MIALNWKMGVADLFQHLANVLQIKPTLLYTNVKPRAKQEECKQGKGSLKKNIQKACIQRSWGFLCYILGKAEVGSKRSKM